MATKSTFFACVTMAAYLAAPIQSCPAKCTCEEEFYNRVTVVCEGQGLTSIPLGLPKNTTKLNLSNNNLTVLDFGMLSDLHRLFEIDLSGNEISMFNGSFDMIESVRLFDLSHNNIEFIPRKTFIHAFHKFRSISLRGNPFNCDCNEWNSDLCDCSEDIFSCTCNMQWLQEMINHVLWDDEYTLRATLCHKPAAVHNVPITAVNFKPHECETKYQKIVGGTVTVVLIIAVVSAYVLYKWKKCCHCYDETNENVGQNIKEEQCELTVNDPTPPSVCHASAHQYQAPPSTEKSGSGSVDNGETNPMVTREHITDNEHQSGSAESLEDLIKRNYPLLQEKVQVSDLFPHLIKRDFLQFDEKEDISSRTTTQGKADALLELLSRQGKCTSKEFVEILRIGKHKHIIDQLE